MAYTTINKSTAHFNTKLYTGDGSSSRNITGVGFKPDLLWIKNRNATQYHFLFDVVRGVSKALFSNDSATESTQASTQTAFLSDGFTVGNDAASNGNGNGIASWNWKTGTSFSNSAGANGASIASTGSVNTAAGFSIISYTGSGSNATVAHGLGVAPKMIIVKNRQGSNSWRVAHDSIGWNKSLFLDNTNSAQTEAYFQNTAPTSQVFYIGTDGGTNGNNNNIIAYCFADVQGYSKFGSYKGNNNTNGTFINTGFSPAFIMVKKTSGTGGWQVRDNKRTAYGNETKNLLYANATSTEQTTDGFDFLSNGFKWRNQASDCNGNGDYIYMAFAEAPLVGTNGITAKAR